MNAKSPRGRSANDPRPQRVAGRGLENPGAFGPATCCEPGRFAVRRSADGPRPQRVALPKRSATRRRLCAARNAENRGRFAVRMRTIGRQVPYEYISSRL